MLRDGHIRIRRSLLATPGSVEAKVEKARAFPVDVLMLDLEGGVPETDAAKARAREVVAAALAAPGGFAAREVAVRVNGPKTRWFLRDAELVARLPLSTVVVPMIHDADDMVFVERCLEGFGAPESLGLILLIETPAAVLNLPAIVARSRRTNGLIAGGLDYARGTGSLALLPGRAPAAGGADADDLVYLRHRVLAVARAHGLSALDAMRPEAISDLASFRAAAERARWLGFDGVDFFHPAFIEVANAVFTPSAEELAWAERALAARAAAGDEATASIKVDDGVLLPQHVELARRLVAVANAIAGR